MRVLNDTATIFVTLLVLSKIYVHSHSAFLSELNRIWNQINQNLCKSCIINKYKFWSVICSIEAEVYLFIFCFELMHLDNFAYELLDLCGRRTQLDFWCL